MKQFSSSALDWLSMILEERFGHTFNLTPIDQGIKLTLSNYDGGAISFPETYSEFFQRYSDIPFTTWDAQAEGWQSALNEPLPAPGKTHLPSSLIEFNTLNNSCAYVHYDILGLIYWMLNRIEEIGRTDLDNHGRFPAIHSHAYKNDYLERPIVDEWLHILGQVICRVWPDIRLTQHKFSTKVSHDVDTPSLYGFKSWGTIFRMMVGHLLKRGDIKAFIVAFWVKLTTRKKLHLQDPYNTFDWLMEQSEVNNLTSAFYFICGGMTDKDADYILEDPLIQELMLRIYRRGHEIGLHPSYATYKKPELIRQEAMHLRSICERAGIIQTSYGGRMHYLRWEQPTTLQAWEDAGLSYDSTLSYADRPGFRCGTCFEYPAFNPITQQLLNIRIRPLIAMECTVIDPIYLGMGVTQNAEKKFLELKEKCRKLDGCFTLLWHNSYFDKEGILKNMYCRIIESKV